MSVNKNTFITEMAKFWELPVSQGGLENIGSSPLREAWGALCQTLNAHAEGKLKNRWSILPLPTGSGKTQALCLYCGLLSLKKTDHPGVLIVTRFTQQADELRDRINEHCTKYGGRVSAFAFHSALPIEQDFKRPDIQDVPIAIITHSLYSRVMAADSNEQEMGSSVERYHLWQGNKSRRLIVIDESLDVVEESQIDIDEIRLLRAFIPHNREQEFQAEIHTIDMLIHGIMKHSIPSRKNERKRIRDHEIIRPDFWKKHKIDSVNEFDWKKLKDFFATINYSRLLSSKEDKPLNGIVVQKMSKIVNSIQTALAGTSWIGEKQGRPVLSTPYISLPTNLRSTVVLDATAKHHHVYKLLQPFAEFVPIPEDIRTYKNVKLYVRTIEAVGKDFLSKQHVQFFKKIIRSEIRSQSKDRNVLMCVHKTTQEKLKNINKQFRTLRVAHWGSIDGKNDWQNCDAALIVGLPNFDDFHPNNALFAFKNWRNKALDLNEPISVNTKDDTDRENYKFGHLVTSLVQAINRIHCRRVIDRQGNCPNTNIVLYLGKRDKHQKIIAAIKDMMPEISIIHTEDNAGEGKRVSNKLQAAFVSILKKLRPGKYDGETIRVSLAREYGKAVSQRTFERIIEWINDSSTKLSIEVASLGVIYSSTRGRYGGKFFTKT